MQTCTTRTLLLTCLASIASALTTVATWKALDTQVIESSTNNSTSQFIAPIQPYNCEEQVGESSNYQLSDSAASLTTEAIIGLSERLSHIPKQQDEILRSVEQIQLNEPHSQSINTYRDQTLTSAQASAISTFITSLASGNQPTEEELNVLSQTRSSMTQAETEEYYRQLNDAIINNTLPPNFDITKLP